MYVFRKFLRAYFIQTYSLYKYVHRFSAWDLSLKECWPVLMGKKLLREGTF